MPKMSGLARLGFAIFVQGKQKCHARFPGLRPPTIPACPKAARSDGAGDDDKNLVFWCNAALHMHTSSMIPDHMAPAPAPTAHFIPHFHVASYVFVTRQQILDQPHLLIGEVLFWMFISPIVAMVLFLSVVVLLRCYQYRNSPEVIQEVRRVPQAPRGLLRRDPQVTRGLYEREIELFPLTARHPLGDDEDKCSICLEEFTDDGPQVRTLPCSHFFHAPCIDEWLKLKGSCPLCIRPYTQARVRFIADDV